LFNIIIHLGTAILAWWLVLVTFSTPAMKDEEIAKRANLIAFFVGLVFVVHPIQTEAVTYIVQRATSLASLFYLLSLSLYIKSRLSYKNFSLKTSRFCYIASLIACIMAMFTKEIAITLPLIILLYEFYFLKDKEFIDWKSITPFLSSMLVVPLAMFMTKSVNFMEMCRISESVSHISPLSYLLTEFRVMVTYLRLFFLPINQNLDYDYATAKSIFELPILASALLLILIIFVALRLSRNYRLLSFSIFWIFLTLLPESSIIPIQDVIFEHRLYLPMVGYSLLLVTLIYFIFGKKRVWAMTLILIMMINWYALLTYTRNFDWYDNITLWDDTVHKSPGKARSYFNRGIAYAVDGEHKKAFFDLDKSLSLYYNQIGKIRDYAKVHDKLIMPDYGELYNFLGTKFAEINLFEHATILFKEAIKNHPSNIKYYTNLCAAYGDLKKFKEAIKSASKAIELDPNSGGAHYNLSVAYYFDKQYDLAFRHLGIATNLGFRPDPDFVAKVKKAR
jgi:tetratricopeptide (TPR) repeat protein